MTLNEFSEKYCFSSFSYERMFQQFFRAWSFFGIFPQAQCYQVFESGAEVTIKNWRWLFRNDEEDLHWVYIEVWRLLFGKLDCCNA